MGKKKKENRKEGFIVLLHREFHFCCFVNRSQYIAAVIHLFCKHTVKSSWHEPPLVVVGYTCNTLDN
ncbi:hypothetical protein VNO77_26740 [Canavalia gladiata]|uniref:Uncharacterized protein n=1 Tax=Canavalia gladiata TaxID=3824 RepID=A0AAN9KSX2_CANGL